MRTTDIMNDNKNNVVMRPAPDPPTAMRCMLQGFRLYAWKWTFSILCMRKRRTGRMTLFEIY